MLRRNFLQLLSALPLLGWLRPEVDPGVPYVGKIYLPDFIAAAPMRRVSIDDLEASGMYNPAAIAKLRT
jgi:hypothetical protein